MMLQHTEDFNLMLGLITDLFEFGLYQILKAISLNSNISTISDILKETIINTNLT